ncbi:MAG: hypothetical protein ACI8S6_004937 [Myxococcota bacterium]|jgi:hypothetical protein
MSRTLSLSPVLALFLAGCDLGALIPDNASDEPAVEERDTPQEQEQDDETTPDDDSDEVGCCSMEIEVPVSVVSGEQVKIGVSLLSDDGADVSGEASLTLTVIGPDGALGVDGLSFVPMTAGAYTVTVSAEVAGSAAEARAELTVEVGAAARISMSLSESSVDPGDTVVASLEGWDVGGNAADVRGAALSVSPADCAAVNGLSLTALVDGDCEVTASVGTLAEVASFLVDGNGPLISLETPGRAAFVSSGALRLSGSAQDDASGVASLTVDGVTVSDPGAFSTSLSLSPGAHTVTVAAVDHDGNTSDLIVGLIAGEYIEDGAALETFQVMRDAETIAELGAMIGEALAAEDIAGALLTGEPIYDTTDGCSGMTITVTDVSVGAVGGAVAPVDGALEVTLTVSDLVIDLEAEGWGEVRGECYSSTTDDQVSVEDATVVVAVSLAAEGGGVHVEIIESGALLSGVDEGMSADYDVDVIAIIEEALLAQAEGAVPALLEGEVFADLALSESIALMGAAIGLEAAVTDVSVTTDGMRLALAGTAECAVSVFDAPGSLALSSSSAALSGDSAALSVDLLNRMMHLGWRSGGMSQHIPHEQLGLDPSIIGLLFPGAETLSLTLEPQLPPVAMDVGAGEALSLDVPELQAEAWGEVDGVEVLLGRVSLHLSGTAQPAIRRGVLSLDVDVTGMVVDSIDPEAGEVAAAEGLEDMLSLFGGSLGGELLGDVSLALPETLGSPASAATDGAGWLILSE